MVSFVFLRLSLPVSVTLSPTSHISVTPPPPPLPPRNGFRWANFISVMPLVCNSQFGGKWPPLFIEGLFIWTTWLLCPNPEITFGAAVRRGLCVSVIRSRLFMRDWHRCTVAWFLFGWKQDWLRTTKADYENIISCDATSADNKPHLWAETLSSLLCDDSF